MITVLGIAAGLALPMIGDTRVMRLRAAARMLAADLEFAQMESIAHGDAPRLIKLGPAGDRYWIAPAGTPDTPIADPLDGTPFVTRFGTGRASGTAGVTIHSFDLGGDAVLKFDAYGSPDQAADATITLAGGGQTLTVRVAAGSGEVSVE